MFEFRLETHQVDILVLLGSLGLIYRFSFGFYWLSFLNHGIIYKQILHSLILSGKTTLLKILAGKHMVGGKNIVQVLNRSAFHDTDLVCSGDLSYLGGSWSKTAGSAVS